MSELLRKTIRDSGLPLLTIEQATGVKRQSIARFLEGEGTLRLDMAEKLASYFGIECVRKGR